MASTLVAALAAAGTLIQDVTCGAREGDTIYVHEKVHGGNVDVNRRLTLIDEGAAVCGC